MMATLTSVANAKVPVSDTQSNHINWVPQATCHFCEYLYFARITTVTAALNACPLITHCTKISMLSMPQEHKMNFCTRTVHDGKEDPVGKTLVQ